MICHTCTHRATKTTTGKGHFLLWGCREKRITFGNTSDWNKGKNQPKTCKERKPSEQVQGN